MFVHSCFAITRRKVARRRRRSRFPHDQPCSTERQSVPVLSAPSSSCRNKSIQGRDREDHSASQRGPPNCVFFQLARPSVLGSLFPDAAVYPQRQTQRYKHPPLNTPITRTTWAVRRGCRPGFGYIQFRLEEARSEALGVADIFKRLGAAPVDRGGDRRPGCLVFRR